MPPQNTHKKKNMSYLLLVLFFITLFFFFSFFPLSLLVMDCVTARCGSQVQPTKNDLPANETSVAQR